MANILKNMFGKKTDTFPKVDFNSVVSNENLDFWIISKGDDGRVMLEFSFEKDGIQSTIRQRFDTIMEAVEYFYNFLKTI